MESRSRVPFGRLLGGAALLFHGANILASDVEFDGDMIPNKWRNGRTLELD